MIIDSTCMVCTSLHAIAKSHVSDRQDEKHNCHDNKESVLHSLSPTLSLNGKSPSAFLAPPPPDHPNGGRILVLCQDSLNIGQERRLVRVIATPFVSHQQAIENLVVERDRVFFERLADPAEQRAAIRHVFTA